VSVSTESRWLDDEEQHTWRVFLEAAGGLFDKLDRQLQRDAVMPHAYFEILVRLSEMPGRSCRMSELAGLTRSSRSRLSHAVAKLEAHGWVRRRDCEDDKRGQLAELTEDGFRALSKAVPGHVQAVREALFDRLTKKQQTALREIAELLLA
jgi:DNA-binding MarR family transcriptional regulator